MALRETIVFRRRVLLTLAVAAGLLVGHALPAQADSNLVKKKSYSVNGKSGSVSWYTDRSGGKVTNWVNVTANDSGGSASRCTEVWWDYSTKPHQHFNPGVVVNCSGSNRTASRIHVTNYHGIAGIGVIVCDVPDTNGPISRSSKNCNGNIGSMYLRSGQKYSSFSVKAMQFPSGIKVYRI
jgi:hypothetical protein